MHKIKQKRTGIAVSLLVVLLLLTAGLTLLFANTENVQLAEASTVNALFAFDGSVNDSVLGDFSDMSDLVGRRFHLLQSGGAGSAEAISFRAREWQVVAANDDYLTLWMHGPYRNAAFNPANSNVWGNSQLNYTHASSILRTDLTAALAPFTEEVRDAFLLTNIAAEATAHNSTNPAVVNSRIWLPSSHEVHDTGIWGLTNNAARAAPNNGFNDWSWLRSASSGSAHSVSGVSAGGDWGVSAISANHSRGVRPSVHIDASAIARSAIVEAEITGHAQAATPQGGRLRPQRGVSGGAAPPTNFDFANLSPDPFAIDFDAGNVPTDPQRVGRITIYGTYGTNYTLASSSSPQIITIADTQPAVGVGWTNVALSNVANPLDGIAPRLVYRAFFTNANRQTARVELALIGQPGDDSDHRFNFNVQALGVSNGIINVNFDDGSADSASSPQSQPAPQNSDRVFTLNAGSPVDGIAQRVVGLSIQASREAQVLPITNIPIAVYSVATPPVHTFNSLAPSPSPLVSITARFTDATQNQVTLTVTNLQETGPTQEIVTFTIIAQGRGANILIHDACDIFGIDLPMRPLFFGNVGDMVTIGGFDIPPPVHGIPGVRFVGYAQTETQRNMGMATVFPTPATPNQIQIPPLDQPRELWAIYEFENPLTLTLNRACPILTPGDGQVLLRFYRPGNYLQLNAAGTAWVPIVQAPFGGMADTGGMRHIGWSYTLEDAQRAGTNPVNTALIDHDINNDLANQPRFFEHTEVFASWRRQDSPAAVIFNWNTIGITGDTHPDFPGITFNAPANLPAPFQFFSARHDLGDAPRIDDIPYHAFLGWATSMEGAVAGMAANIAPIPFGTEVPVLVDNTTFFAVWSLIEITVAMASQFNVGPDLTTYIQNININGQTFTDVEAHTFSIRFPAVGSTFNLTQVIGLSQTFSHNDLVFTFDGFATSLLLRDLGVANIQNIDQMQNFTVNMGATIYGMWITAGAGTPLPPIEGETRLAQVTNMQLSTWGALSFTGVSGAVGYTIIINETIERFIVATLGLNLFDAFNYLVEGYNDIMVVSVAPATGGWTDSLPATARLNFTEDTDPRCCEDYPNCEHNLGEPLPTPTGIAVSPAGLVTWNPVGGAVSYLVRVNGENAGVATPPSRSVDISSFLTESGLFVIEVIARPATGGGSTDSAAGIFNYNFVLPGNGSNGSGSTPGPGPEVNRGALRDEINRVSSYIAANGLNYTAPSRSVVDSWLSVARGVYANGNATQAQVNNALAQLTAAYNALVLVTATPPPAGSVNLGALQALYDQVLAHMNQHFARYTEGSRAEVMNQLSNTLSVLNNPLTTQSQVSLTGEALQLAFISLVVNPDGPPVISVNRQDLIDRIFEITTYINANPNRYTAGSISSISNAVNHAVAVANNPTATQAQIDGALVLLNGAFDARVQQGATVVPGEDRQALEDLLNQIRDHMRENGGNYTDETAIAVQNAIDEAQRVLNDPNSTQAQIDQALAQLQAIRDMLQLVEEEEEEGGFLRWHGWIAMLTFNPWNNLWPWLFYGLALILLLILLVIVPVVVTKKKRARAVDSGEYDKELDELRGKARDAINAAFSDLKVAGECVVACDMAQGSDPSLDQQAMAQLSKTDAAMSNAESCVAAFLKAKKLDKKKAK